MDIEELVRYATLAPSGHNTQPWKFTVDTDVVRIHPDLTRRLPVVDPDDHALYISLGCALENLIIAAAEDGFESRVRYLPDCLEVTLVRGRETRQSRLILAIPARRSNRRAYDGRRVPPDDLRQLLEAGRREGVQIRPLEVGDSQLEPVIELVKDANRAQLRDRAFVNELVAWIRFSRKEARDSGDGLTATALGFPAIPRWLGTLIMTHLVSPDGEANKAERAIRGSSLVLVFSVRRHDRQHWIDLGRSFERVALTATALGIAHAHLNMPCEVESVRVRLASELGLQRGEQPLLLTRFGYAPPVPPAPRRPLEQVLTDRSS